VANRAGPQASIGNGQTLNADAAVYWHLLVAAVYAAVGVWVVATEGTRTYARQLYLWVNRNKPGFNPAWHPDDSRAYHVAGRCVDVGSGVGYMATIVSRAFYKLAGAYGFRATIAGEPWHFEWRLEWVAAHIRFAAAVAASSPIKEIKLNPSEFVSVLLNSAAYTPAPNETPVTVSQVLKSLHTGLWEGGDSTNGLGLAQQVVDIHKTVTQPVRRGGEVTQIQDAADTGTIVRRIESKVDALAPKPGPPPVKPVK